MAAIRALRPEQASRSFSYLYAANLLGAMLGALGSAFVGIELLGFRGTMRLAAALNVLVAVLALIASRRLRRRPPPALASAAPSEPEPAPTQEQRVVWSGRSSSSSWQRASRASAWRSSGPRQFVPFQGPLVYTFATILAVYLGASALGTVLYRFAFRRLSSASRGEGWRGRRWLPPRRGCCRCSRSTRAGSCLESRWRGRSGLPRASGPTARSSAS